MNFPRNFFNAIVFRGELIPVGYNTNYSSHADWVMKHLELEPGWRAKLSDSEIPLEVYKKYPKLIRLTSDLGEGWVFVETGNLNYDVETLLMKYVLAFPKARFKIELSLADKNKIYKFTNSDLLSQKLRDLIRDPKTMVASTDSDELKLYYAEIGNPESGFGFSDLNEFKKLFTGAHGFIEVLYGTPEAKDLSTAMGLSEENVEEYFSMLELPMIDQAAYFHSLASGKASSFDPNSGNYFIIEGGPESLASDYLMSQDDKIFNQIKDFINLSDYAKSIGVKTFKYGKRIYSILWL